MIDLKENSVKFILMFMEADRSDKLANEIDKYNKTKAMKIAVEQKEDFDFDTFDFSEMAEKLRKHIPALSDTQLDRAIHMCKLKKAQIRSKSQLIQVIIDHL
jgi:hypothetical protein